MKLKVGLAQVAPKLGDVQSNLRMHLDTIAHATQQGLQLLCFPELSLTGYALRDLVSEVAMPADEKDPVMAQLLTASHDIDLLFGFIEVDARYRHFIAAAYLSQGHVVHVHRKLYLPTYGMFEEGRFLATGGRVRAFGTSFGRVGVLICEDFWHMSAAYALWMDGADVLLFVSASPGRGLSREPALASSRSVQLMNQAYATFFTTFVLHCNRVGFEDGLNFWGGSTVFGPDGKVVCEAPYFEPTLLTAELDLSALRRARQQLPLLRDERPDLLYRELRRLCKTED